MENYFNVIEKKLKEKINFEKLEIIDNSHKHKTHKSFNSEKYHLKLKIRSSYLNSIPRTTAHKIIMTKLKNDFKTKIHALEISIEQ